MEYGMFFKDITELFYKYRKKGSSNIFEILGISNKETIHSAIIAHLLREPSFFSKFIEQLGLDPKEFPGENFKIYTERKANNGYIDIAIEWARDKKVLIIENKIWAGDQERQLVRYYTSYKERDWGVTLIYLTLDGKLPSQNSSCDLPEKILLCKSYEYDILNWLNECQTDDNQLQTIICMYIKSIRKTINRDEYMEKIIKYLQEKPEALTLAIDVMNALKTNDPQKLFPGIDLKERFFDILKDKLSEKEIDYNENVGSPEDGVYTLDIQGEEITYDINTGDVRLEVEDNVDYYFFNIKHIHDPNLQDLILYQKDEPENIHTRRFDQTINEIIERIKETL